MVLSCIFIFMVLLGGIPLLLGLIAGELFDFADGLLEGFDGFLEGFGIDIFPDDLGIGSSSGFGTAAILAAFTLFGAFGLLASWYGLGSLLSVLVAILAGVITLVATARFIVLISKEMSSHVDDENFIGLSATVSSTIPNGGIGRITVTVSGRTKRVPAKNVVKGKIETGTNVVIVKKEATIAYVKTDLA